MISSAQKMKKKHFSANSGYPKLNFNFFIKNCNLYIIHIVHTLVKVLYAVLRYYRFIYVGRGAKNG